MSHSPTPGERFQQIIDQHQAILIKVARMYCPYDHERADLVQEMLLQIWKALPSYQDKFALTTWLYRIALNVAISYHRKGNPLKKASIPLSDNHTIIAEPTEPGKEQQLTLLEQMVSVDFQRPGMATAPPVDGLAGESGKV